MKTLLPLCFAAVAAVAISAHNPLAAQTASPAPTATISPTVSASASPSGELADKLHQRFGKKFGRHHGITIDTDDDEGDHGDMPKEIIPIVAISLLAVFGTPILIVALAGMFIFSASRQRHRTIRMMVEKGQPVPAELLMPPTRAARQHSDMRRGVIWTLVGIGLMVWLAAVNDWEGGAWSFGLIPFLIGLGYLTVWKLETKKDVPTPPPLP